MTYCISKDMGAGNPPAFLIGIRKGTIWGTMDNALQYANEDTARAVIDGYDDLMGCIPMPYNEPVDMSEADTELKGQDAIAQAAEGNTRKQF